MTNTERVNSLPVVDYENLLAEYQSHQIKVMLEDCLDQQLKENLKVIGIKDFTRLFRAYRQFQQNSKDGRISYVHLLNYLRKGSL